MAVVEKTLRWIVIGGIFLLPFVCLIVAQSLFFPYITGKNFTFRVVVEIITGAWLALALIDTKYRPRRSWILAAFAIFVIIIAIADAQGVNPFKSFWSNYERMDGWVTLIHLLMYLVVAVSVLNTENLWRRLFQLSLVVSAFVSVYGFLQIAGALAVDGTGSGGLTARIDATFGNPIYLAVYMLFHVFIAAILWAQTWSERKAGDRLVASLLYAAVIVVDTIALLFTGTRGTMLGLFGGGLLALILFAWSSSGSKRLRTATVGIVAIMIVGSGVLWAARETPLVQGVVFLNRLSSISLTDTTIASRFINMSIAWQGVKERPILGWGQENYAIVFDKYYNPALYDDEQWFDRVHDIIFDWWVAGGTLGLLAYLSIFAAVLWVLWKSPAFSAAERALMVGMLAGYFIHNLTVFDNITSYILFITVIAYIAWRASSFEQSPPVIPRFTLPSGTLPIVAALCAVVVWGGAWWTNSAALAENKLIIAGISAQGDLSQNLQYFQAAIAYGTYGTQEAREQLIQAATEVSQAQAPDATKQQFFSVAQSEMRKQEAASPLDARFPLFLGVLENAYGDYTDASKDFEQAHEDSPDKQAILFEVGVNDEDQNDIPDALHVFEQAYELAPAYSEARILYAAALITSGQVAAADPILAPLIPTGAAADPRIAAAYVSQKRYDKIVTIWQAHVQADPTDIQGYFTLAAAYYEGGNKAEAIATLQQAEAASPSSSTQVDTLIQQIQNGTVQLQ